MSDAASPPADEAYLRIPEVERRTGLDHSTIYARIKKGTFPLPRMIGERAVAWLQSEVVAWMHAQPVAEGRPGPRSRPRGQKAA